MAQTLLLCPLDPILYIPDTQVKVPKFPIPSFVPLSFLGTNQDLIRYFNISRSILRTLYSPEGLILTRLKEELPQVIWLGRATPSRFRIWFEPGATPFKFGIRRTRMLSGITYVVIPGWSLIINVSRNYRRIHHGSASPFIYISYIF